MSNSKITRLVEAITYIDNEGVRLRDQAKAVRKIPESFELIDSKRRELYAIKERLLYILNKQSLLRTLGYLMQKAGKHNTRIYQNLVVGDESETPVTSLKAYTKNSENNRKKLGTTGLADYREMDGMTFEEALQIVLDYIDDYGKQSRKAYEYELKQLRQSGKKPKSKPKVKETYDIKETKLVELSRLRIVKDVHINAKFNPKGYAEKKAELAALVEENGGKYPKSEALVAVKSKDPKDRRKVVYNLEDGLRRLVISQELGLEKVYVSLIDA